MSLTERLLQLKFEFRSHVAREPWLSPLHNLVVWWTQYKQAKHIDIRECRVGPHTEFVLDGFQGTANSFATRAFKYAQEDSVLIAHHLHSPAQVIEAVERGIPALVTLRAPKDAVASLISRWPYVTPRQGLRSYTKFYKKLEPYDGGFVLSPFEQTTQHLDRVFRAVNDEFGVQFDIFEHSEQNVHAIRDPESLKSDEEVRRRRRKSRVKERLTHPKYESLVRRAEAVHRSLQSHGLK
jgi:hypothetical protein